MLSVRDCLTGMCSDNVVRPVYSGVRKVSLFYIDLQYLSFSFKTPSVYLRMFLCVLQVTGLDWI